MANKPSGRMQMEPIRYEWDQPRHHEKVGRLAMLLVYLRHPQIYSWKDHQKQYQCDTPVTSGRKWPPTRCQRFFSKSTRDLGVSWLDRLGAYFSFMGGEKTPPFWRNIPQKNPQCGPQKFPETSKVPRNHKPSSIGPKHMEKFMRVPD